MEQKLSQALPSRPMEFVPLNDTEVTVASVGALIYSKKTKRYLFLLRNGSKFADTWGIPGGKINTNETVIDALKREVSEETNFDITDTKIIPLETFTTSNQYFCYHTFLVITDKEFIPLLNHEHKGWAWTNIECIPKPIHPGLFKTVHISEILSKIKVIEDNTFYLV